MEGEFGQSLVQNKSRMAIFSDLCLSQLVPMYNVHLLKNQVPTYLFGPIDLKNRKQNDSYINHWGNLVLYKTTSLLFPQTQLDYLLRDGGTINYMYSYV